MKWDGLDGQSHGNLHPSFSSTQSCKERILSVCSKDRRSRELYTTQDRFRRLNQRHHPSFQALWALVLASKLVLLAAKHAHELVSQTFRFLQRDLLVGLIGEGPGMLAADS